MWHGRRRSRTLAVHTGLSHHRIDHVPLGGHGARARVARRAWARPFSKRLCRETYRSFSFSLHSLGRSCISRLWQRPRLPLRSWCLGSCRGLRIPLCSFLLSSFPTSPIVLFPACRPLRSLRYRHLFRPRWSDCLRRSLCRDSRGRSPSFARRSRAWGIPRCHEPEGSATNAEIEGLVATQRWKYQRQQPAAKTLFMRSAKADVATSWAVTKRAAQSSMYTCNMHYNPPILGFHNCIPLYPINLPLSIPIYSQLVIRIYIYISKC